MEKKKISEIVFVSYNVTSNVNYEVLLASCSKQHGSILVKQDRFERRDWIPWILTRQVYDVYKMTATIWWTYIYICMFTVVLTQTPSSPTLQNSSGKFSASNYRFSQIYAFVYIGSMGHLYIVTHLFIKIMKLNAVQLLLVCFFLSQPL